MNITVISNHSLGTYTNCEVYKLEAISGSSSFKYNTINDTINYKDSAIIKRNRIFGCEYQSFSNGNCFTLFTHDMKMVDKNIDDKQSRINMAHASYILGSGIHFVHDGGAVFINKDAISALIVNNDETETEVVFEGSFTMKCSCRSVNLANVFRYKLLN